MQPLTATVGFVGPALPGIDYAARVAALNDDPGTVLELKPLRPLNPKSGYLLIVTDGVQDITGDAAVADDVYQGLKDAIAAGVTLPDPQEEGVKQLIGAHLAIAAAAGINADNVVGNSCVTCDVLHPVGDDPGTVLELKPLRPLNPKSGYLLTSAPTARSTRPLRPLTHS